MQLNHTEDTRHSIQRLTRRELEYLARKEGRSEIEPGMPAELMQRHFMSRPPSAMPRPMRGRLGTLQPLRIPPYGEWLRIAFGVEPRPEPQVEVKEVNAMDDLMKQWEAQKAAKPKDTITELRKECKRRGIKIKRTDKTADLRAKLDGQQNAS